MNYPYSKNFLSLLICLTWISAVLVLGSCRAYKENLMLQIDEDDYQSLNPLVDVAQESYIIQAHDKLEITVYTNKGEQLIDPNRVLQSEPATSEPEKPHYTVGEDGKVNLPILGEVALNGKSLAQANQLLVERYSVYYKSPYVKTTYINKRVVVLGASEKVIPLPNEGMNLLEVLALAGGLNENGKSHNIRLIRGDLSNPQVAIVDLSSLEGMRQANLQVYPNDIIYVEPAKRPFAALRDFSPILVAFTSVLALIVALTR